MRRPETPRSSRPEEVEPVEILQRLLRFDTTNPPGNERDCIAYAARLLESGGFETTLLALSPDRPNLLSRLPGQGAAPPLLFYGHLDVATTRGQSWTYPPFSGTLADGYVWGRGALDMKGGVAMLLAALLRARKQGIRPRGDIVLLLLADEEEKGQFGARFLVEQHPEVLTGIRHAIGEFGGFTLHVDGCRFYPIMVAEKQVCRLRITLRGRGGHGSMPIRGGAMTALGELLTRLDRPALPIHPTPAARLFFSALARELSWPRSWLLRGLLVPSFAGPLLALLGDRREKLEPLLRNTVAVTAVRGGGEHNVIPSEVEVDLDGRLLPGFGPQDLVRELRESLELPPDDDGEGSLAIEVTRFDPGPSEMDLSLFNTLAGALRKLDPEGIPVPFLLTGTTDARHLCRLGIQTYGFMPMRLPPDFDFAKTLHAADERVPPGSLDFGTKVLLELIEKYPGDA